MRYPQFLFVCCCSSIFAVTSSIKVDGHSCVSAYRDTVSCVLNITGDALGPSNTTYNLTFTRIRLNIKEKFSCPLLWINHRYHCECKVTGESRNINTGCNYDIELCNGSACQSLMKRFYPFKKIQLTPPYDVKVQQTPEAFNITWKSGYENHEFFKKRLYYEVLLQSFQSSENKIHDFKSFEEFVWIPHDKSYAEFCIKVRSLPGKFSTIWSEWSPLTCWKNYDKIPEEENTSVILTKVLTPLCVVFAILLFVCYSPAARMKIKTLSHTPSPAPFFQPLFQQYEGNLQDWLSPQSKCVLIYKTEEMLTTHAVNVVPKPMTKDPEENQDFHIPAVTQLPLTQCQTSYVGLPGMHKVSSPLTMVCPGNTSYTQLPFSVFNTGEVQVMSSPPKDSLEFSCSDSGCSFELTESPDCSLPTTPVADSSPSFYPSDYCILSKTAGGVVPVLMTKGGSPNISSEPDREDEN